ncbi:MAG: HEAT repeat domain-containing protein [Terracidiphilus sp.]|jgi:HEAT repeat protein
MALVRGKAAGDAAKKAVQPAGKSRPKPASCEELAAGLESADAAVRRHAAREILACADAGAALVSRLKREEEIAVREAILTALIRLDDPAATAGLAGCLRSEDVALRNEAIEALRELAASGDSAGAVPPVLASLLADPDPDVRIFAVNVMESMVHPDVERWLIEVIETDLHINVCATAVDLLCEVGTEAAIDPLVRLQARFAPEPYIQFAADLALKRIREI